MEKFILQLEGQLIDRNVTIEFSDDTLKWLADEGYDEKMGARPISRKIQEHIKKPLSEALLFGELKKGGIVKLSINKFFLSLVMTSAGGESLSSNWLEKYLTRWKNGILK